MCFINVSFFKFISYLKIDIRISSSSSSQIKWLLKDEIASARRHIFPVTVETLDMVASHVCNSLNNKTCLYEQVDLKFVFGPEQSLSEFVKVNFNI